MSREQDSGSELGKISETGRVSLDQQWMEVRVDAGELARVANAADAVVGQCRMHFEKDRLRLEATDRSAVTVVDAEITDIHWGTDMEPLTVGVNTDELVSGVTFFEQTGDIDIRIDDDSDQLKVTNDSYIDWVPLQSPTHIQDQPDTSEWEYSATVEVDAMKFKGAVGAVSCAASYGVRLASGHGSLKAESKDWRTGEYDHEWTIDAETSGEITSNLFAEGCLGNITDAIDPDGTVCVYLSDNYPLQVVSDNVEFLLAPRIEADEEEA